MFCPKCGKEATENSAFCAYCGQDLSEKLTVNDDDSSSLFELCKKPVFLVITIMLSVSVCASLAYGTLNVFLSLIVLSLWLLFASAKGSNEKLQKNGVKIAAVTVKVQYILNYVLAGIVALFGIIALSVFAVSGDLFAVLGDLIAEVADELAEEAAGLSHVGDLLYALADFVGSSEGILIGIAVMIGFFIAAIFMVIINLIFTKYFSGYFEAMSKSLDQSRTFKLYDSGLRSRILATAIITCVTIPTSLVGLFSDLDFDVLVSLITTTALCAACFTSYSAMKK